jgi:hypothetical protein
MFHHSWFLAGAQACSCFLTACGQHEVSPGSDRSLDNDKIHDDEGDYGEIK